MSEIYQTVDRGDRMAQIFQALFDVSGLGRLFSRVKKGRIAGIQSWEQLFLGSAMVHFAVPADLLRETEHAAYHAVEEQADEKPHEDVWKAPTPINGYVAQREQWY